MPIDRKKESAAIQIQHWWRIHLKQHEKLAEKTRRIIEWRGMQDISLHNTELIERLKVIRRQKAYDLMKYEHILHLPARKVGEFLSKECEMPSALARDESEEILEKIEYERQHKAAKVIQRAFKSYHKKRLAKKYLRSVTQIRPQRRVQLIGEINDRMNRRTSLRKEHLTVMKEKLAAYRAERGHDANSFAKRQLTIQSMKRDIAIMNSIRPGMHITLALLKCLGSARPLSKYKATLHHDDEMERIEDRLTDLSL